MLLSPLTAALELAAPRACACCGRPAVAVCDPCRTALDAEWFADGPRQVRVVDGVVCVASGPFDGVARALVHAFKDGERRDVGALLAPGLLAAVLHPSVRATSEVVLVPAPSSARSRRRRGDDPLVRLTRDAARPCGLQVLPALQVVRRVADQAGLRRAERARNVTGAFRVRRRLPARPVVVVDDVLTTGATVAECLRALAAAGADTVGVATVLVTERA